MSGCSLRSAASSPFHGDQASILLWTPPEDVEHGSAWRGAKHCGSEVERQSHRALVRARPPQDLADRVLARGARQYLADVADECPAFPQAGVHADASVEPHLRRVGALDREIRTIGLPPPASEEHAWSCVDRYVVVDERVPVAADACSERVRIGLLGKVKFIGFMRLA